MCQYSENCKFIDKEISSLITHQFCFNISTHSNMSRKSAALEAKFEIAVKTLLKAPNLTVQEVMLVAKFST